MQQVSGKRSGIYLTPGGHRRLVEQIEEARRAYREVCGSNEEAAGAGDSSVWHDNFAYEENQRQMHQLARRVRDLEAQLAAARVVPLPDAAPEVVCLGALVTVLIDATEKQRWFIAGFDDGDAAVGRLSYNSPLGEAVLGSEEGDTLDLVLRGTRRRVEVVSIERAERRHDGVEQ